MRNHIFVLSLLLCPVIPAYAQVSLSVGLPGINIGINMGSYPDLVQIPGYPVYYDPQVNSNYFFYDGQYWVFRNNNWYSSTWYNGPWGVVSPQYVPLFVLRVPVRFYRDRPSFFRGWSDNAAPRWGDHWGHRWAQQRAGWDHWNRNSVPAAAPLPVYQRQYSGHRYPTTAAQRNSIRSANYHYRSQGSTPRANVTAQHSRPTARPTQHTPVKQRAPRLAASAHTEAQRRSSIRSGSTHVTREQRAPATQHKPVVAHRPSEQHAPVTKRAPTPKQRVEQANKSRQEHRATPAHPVQHRPSAQQRKPPVQAHKPQAKHAPKDKRRDKNDKGNGGPDSH